MNELLMEVAKATIVVTAFIWIPCGIIGIGWCVRWAVREWRWWQAAAEEAYEDDDEEVIYR